MKKIIIQSISTTLVLFAFIGCSKDFDAKYLEDQLQDHEQRLQNIEAQITSLNTQINSIQTTLTAIEKKLTITSVETITTSPGGYKITFSDGKVATIMNGIDGTSGTAPTIGVDSEGYWLINGDRITANGQEIKAVGKDGTDGDKGDDGLTPIIGVDADGYWTVTVGKQTERIKDENGKDVKARGEDGASGNSFFKQVIVNDDYVRLVLNDSENDSTAVNIPIIKELSIAFAQDEMVGITAGKSVNIEYTLLGANEKTVVKVIAQNGWKASVTPNNSSSGVITITAPDPMEDGEIIVLVSDGQDKTIMRCITLTKGIISIVHKTFIAPIDGGTIEVEVKANVNYSIIIPDTIQWISLVKTKSIRTDSYIFAIASNSGAARFTTITLRSIDNAISETFLIKQDGSQNTIHINIPGSLGTLLTPDELNNIERLKITGQLDIEDCKIIANSMPSLRELDLSDINMTELPAGSFANTSNIKSVKLPKNLTKIPANIFENSSVTFVEIPTTVIQIENYAFAGSNLSNNLNLPNELTTIGDYAFSNCQNLIGNLTIPDNLITIGENAFYNCNKLGPNLTIGYNTDYIGESAFESCTGFSKILSRSIHPSLIGKNTFNNVNKSYLGIAFGSNIFYQESPLWNEFVTKEEIYNLFEEGIPIEWNIKVLKSSDSASEILATNGNASAILTTNIHDKISIGSYHGFSSIYRSGWHKNDYWLIKIPVKNFAPGQLRIQYTQQTAGNGPKYFKFEYSIDNTSWHSLGNYQVPSAPGNTYIGNRTLNLTNTITSGYIYFRMVVTDVDLTIASGYHNYFHNLIQITKTADSF